MSSIMFKIIYEIVHRKLQNIIYDSGIFKDLFDAFKTL